MYVWSFLKFYVYLFHLLDYIFQIIGILYWVEAWMGGWMSGWVDV